MADDVLGGFFALNWGGISKKGLGKIFYLAPDNLQWEETAGSYAEFLKFCFEGNLSTFYSGQRWKNWRQQVDSLSGDKPFQTYPPLWSVEGKDINKDVIKAVPIQEFYLYILSVREQLANQK